MEIVVGADSFVGGNLKEKLGCPGTSRRRTSTRQYFDMLAPDFDFLCQFDTIYLCAAHNGAKACEGSQDAYRVNVDAPIEIARHVDGFVVWISSMSIEWMDGAYQRQKRAAESMLRLLPNVGVVRAGRVLNSNVDDLCKTLIAVGSERLEGVTRWGSDENAYQR